MKKIIPGRFFFLLLLLNFFLFSCFYMDMTGLDEFISSESTAGTNNSQSFYSPTGLFENTFNTGGMGFNNNVLQLAVQSDDKIVTAGLFDFYNAVDVPDKIIRLNTDGSLDTSFNNGGSGADGSVYAVLIQTDGKILVGGNFTLYNGIDAPDKIMRLNTDGSLDTTFNNGGIGPDNYINTIAVQPDGKILIGGNFSLYNGVDVPDMIIRLNADGSFDTTFNNGGVGADATVRTIALQPDGKILVGGLFTSYNGAGAIPNRLIRLNADGSFDSTFNNGGAGYNADVYSIVVLPDEKILVGGFNTQYNAVDCPDRIIRLNCDGTLDAAFNAGGAGVDGGVYSILVQPDGKIIAGGVIGTYNGVDCPDTIIRLHSDGTLDPTFNAGGAGADNLSYSMAFQSSGLLIIGGVFTMFNGMDVPDRLIRLQ